MQKLKVLGVNHIGIAAKDVKAARSFFSTLLGTSTEETVEIQKTHTVMFDTNSPTRIELLEDASKDLSGPIAQFLQKKGGGIHHVAIHVDCIHKAISFAKENGWDLIDPDYKIGAHGTKTVFIHPRSAGGVLVEFVEESHASS